MIRSASRFFVCLTSPHGQTVPVGSFDQGRCLPGIINHARALPTSSIPQLPFNRNTKHPTTNPTTDQHKNRVPRNLHPPIRGFPNFSVLLIFSLLLPALPNPPACNGHDKSQRPKRLTIIMLTTTAATRAAAATGTPTALTPPAATNSTTTPMTAPAPAEATIWDLLRGEQLYRPSSNELVDAASVVGNEQQQNKIVLIYFSAYWCAPCSYFTPILAGLYQTLQQRLGQEQQEQRDNFCAAYPTPCSPSSSLPFEVIYCGMDKTTAQYTRYTQKMPWFCVPFGNQVLTSRLVTHYRANTIPHLVVLDRDGRTVLTNDGVTQVQQDPQGMHFPWRPPPLAAILPRQYLYHRTNSHDNTNGYVSKTETRPFAALRHKHILFYFAAQWCGPCRRTLPFMLQACRKLRAARDDFEVRTKEVLLLLLLLLLLLRGQQRNLTNSRWRFICLLVRDSCATYAEPRLEVGRIYVCGPLKDSLLLTCSRA